MLLNYFTIALRNFWRHKTYSAINILELTLGLNSSPLIFRWVSDELRMGAYPANGPTLAKSRIQTKIIRLLSPSHSSTN